MLADTRSGRQRRGFRVVGVVALALVLVAGGIGVTRLTARTSAAATPPPAPRSVPVTSLTVASQSIDLVRTGLGVVAAWNTATITPQLSGALIDLPFQEGMRVNQGDVIARIDPKPSQAVLDQDIAKKAQDEATLANDRLNLKRDADLAAKKFGTQQQADNDAAAVTQMEAQVRQDQAAIDSASIQLGYTTITAPFAGMLGIRSVDIGNVVSSATAIVTLTQIEPIAVVFSLPQSELSVLQAAMSRGKPGVLAYDEAGKALIARGTLDVINNAIDQSTGTIKLKARFDNSDHKLWPGQFVQVRVVTATEADGIAASQHRAGPRQHDRDRERNLGWDSHRCGWAVRSHSGNEGDRSGITVTGKRSKHAVQNGRNGITPFISERRV